MTPIERLRQRDAADTWQNRSETPGVIQKPDMLQKTLTTAKEIIWGLSPFGWGGCAAPKKDEETKETDAAAIVKENAVKGYQPDSVGKAIDDDWHSDTPSYPSGTSEQERLNLSDEASYAGDPDYAYDGAFGKTQRKVDFDQMQSVFTETGHWQANSTTEDMAYELNKTLFEYGIETQQQIQMFLAVCMHETRPSLTEAGWLSEAQVREYCKQYEPGTEDGDALGNTQVGDGYKFRGAGYIQLTGRDNYQGFSNYIEGKYGYDPNIMKEGADYIAKVYPWEAAGYYWDKYNINDTIKKGNESGQDTTTTFKQVFNAVFRGNAYSKKDPNRWDERLARLDDVLNVY